MVFLGDNRKYWCSHEECGTKEPGGFEGEILVAALNTPFLLYVQTRGLVHIGNKCPEKGSRVVFKRIKSI